MKFNNKRVLSAVICMAVCFSLASCGKKGDSSSEETTTTTSAKAEPAVTEVTEITTTAPEETTTTAATTAKPKEEKKKENLNPLTGLYDVSKSGKGRRPCAVMVNNIAASLPQYGIYNADILFEIDRKSVV